MGRDIEARKREQPARPTSSKALGIPRATAHSLLTHTVALGVLQEAIHAALPGLAVEGALGVLAREAWLAVVCTCHTLVHICHTEAGHQGWEAGGPLPLTPGSPLLYPQ